jgi:hypothetical protein
MPYKKTRNFWYKKLFKLKKGAKPADSLLRQLVLMAHGANNQGQASSILHFFWYL